MSSAEIVTLSFEGLPQFHYEPTYPTLTNEELHSTEFKGPTKADDPIACKKVHCTNSRCQLEAGDSRLSLYLARFSDQHSCDLCKEIVELSEEDWVFQWIRDLSDWESSLSYADSCHQMTFDYGCGKTELRMNRIRDKLGILQTQTPAWKIIDSIKRASTDIAKFYSRGLIRRHVKRKFKEDAQHLIEVTKNGEPLISRNAGEEDRLFSDPEDRLLKAEMAEQKQIKRAITDFVAFHAHLMLQKLYSKIKSEEMELLESPSATLDQPRTWIRTLLSKVIEPPKDGQSSKIALHGPVGERPLHVCSLSAHRFVDTDFLGHGNYMRKGLIQGMKKYLSEDENWSEVHVEYGKDYCALVGAYILNDELKSNPARTLSEVEDKDWPRGPYGTPPFWSELNQRCKKLQMRAVSDLKCWKMCRCVFPCWCCSSGNQKHQMHWDEITKIITVGLFEGETIACPIIAAGDEKSLFWILEREKYQALGRDSQDAAQFHEAPLREDQVESHTSSAPAQDTYKISLVRIPLRGLFFSPMHKHSLTSFSVTTGWHYYINVKQRFINAQASSSSSYFGLSMLAFASSQENTSIFDMVFNRIMEDTKILLEKMRSKLEMNEPAFIAWFGSGKRNNVVMRKTLLDFQDEYGNTVLHIAAKNSKTGMYDHLIELGADPSIKNCDGLTAFTMTARFGIWDMFSHIWDRHLTRTMWKFGNVKKSVLDLSEFDWKGPETFSQRNDIQQCLDEIINDTLKHSKAVETVAAACEKLCQKRKETITGGFSIHKQSTDSLRQLNRKLKMVTNIMKLKRCENQIKNKLKSELSEFLGYASPILDVKNDSDTIRDMSDGMGDAVSGIRLITLFRPQNWYSETKGKVERVILRKWAQGFYLVHIGQSIVPYGVILLFFGIMWWLRKLHILEHNFWWANEYSVQKLEALGTSYPILSNPVKANIAELKSKINISIFGGNSPENGKFSDSIYGPESMCGWSSISHSYSGILQAVLILYSLPSLIRLAYSQRRIRPSDLDENEDMKISFEELVNFIYFNLESLLHIVMCGLFITVGIARVRAGENCDTSYLLIEKNATSLAALFLFLNLFVVCKPYEAIGLLVLTIYKFLVSDVINFLFMYTVFFAAFLIALQTLHNANHVFLAWMDVTDTVVPQIVDLTENMAYLENANIKANTRLQDTFMVLDGCQRVKKTLQDTAFFLLEVSFGDGLAESLEQSRTSDYQCPGFNPDGLITFIIVFWVFLTNVLILNMLIAMMNYTFEKQIKEVRSVWVLDVSYRIMRYERLFPELIVRLQEPVLPYSLWNSKYWLSLFSDFLLIVYCIPEIHCWGFGRALFVLFVRKCIDKNFLKRHKWNPGDDTLKENSAGLSVRKSDFWKDAVQKSTEVVRENVDKKPKSRRMHDFLLHKVKSIKVQHVSHALTALGRSDNVLGDADIWFKNLLEAGAFQGECEHEDNEEYAKVLVLIALICQLCLLKESFDELRSVSTVQIEGTGWNARAGQESTV